MLNSIIILGKSCRYVKEANMEGKLFERPTAQTSKQTPKKATPAKSPPPSGNTSFDYSRNSSDGLCSKHIMYCVEKSNSKNHVHFVPPFLAEPKVQRPSITKQPTPRVKPFPVTPPPVTEVTRDPPPDSPPKPEENSSESPQSTELTHRTTKKDLLEIDRFTICGNRIG